MNQAQRMAMASKNEVQKFEKKARKEVNDAKKQIEKSLNNAIPKASKQVNHRSEIPKAPYYVIAKDNFMSGWGYAEGKENKLIFPVSSYEEAEIVRDNLENRSEMSKIHIRSTKPIVSQEHILWQLLGKETSPNWYKKGMWKRWTDHSRRQ